MPREAPTPETEAAPEPATSARPADADKPDVPALLNRIDELERMLRLIEERTRRNE
jgi:hypothetical protein